MNPALGFTLLFLTTLVLLGAVAVTGRRALRRTHVTLVGLTLASLAGAIAFALELGELYDLEAAGWITPVHLGLAKVATAAFLLPIVTGLWTTRDPARRPLHRRAAVVVGVLAVLAAATGTWMMLGAEPLAEPARLSEGVAPDGAED